MFGCRPARPNPEAQTLSSKPEPRSQTPDPNLGIDGEKVGFPELKTLNPLP